MSDSNSTDLEKIGREKMNNKDSECPFCKKELIQGNGFKFCKCDFWMKEPDSGSIDPLLEFIERSTRE